MSFLTREELAVLWSVHPVTIDRYRREGMPSVDASDEPAPASAPLKLLVTRRELAEHFGVNPDTVTDWLPQGLGAALVVSGGRGKESLFWLPAAVTWRHAMDDQLSRLVLEDFEARAAAGVRIVVLEALAALPFQGIRLNEIMIPDVAATERQADNEDHPAPKGANSAGPRRPRRRR